MKKTIFTGASILALSMAAPAAAQTAPTYPEAPAECATAGNNCSVVDQAGDNSTAVVNQTGSDNISEISQTEDATGVDATVTQEGTEATSFIEQSGGPNNKVDVLQKGEGAESVVFQGKSSQLQVSVDQDGDSKSFVSQEGAKSDVEVTQRGDNHNSVVFQSADISSVGNAFDGNRRTGVVQTGSDNLSEVFQGDLSTPDIVERDLTASVTQNGVNNGSFISQTNAGGRAEATARINQQGDDNESSIQQSGLLGGPFPNGTLVDVQQFGDVNKSDVTQNNGSAAGDATPSSRAIILQDGFRNANTVDQTSLSANAEVTQVGEFNVSEITQSGAGTTSAFVIQIGNGNNSTVTQSGDNPTPDNAFDFAVEVNQLGTDGKSVVSQAGSGNEAGLLQLAGSVEEDSSITQSGDDNLAEVIQGGHGNLSSVIQTGNGNTAAVNQYSDNNVSNVTQTGNGNTATVTQGFAPLP